MSVPWIGLCGKFILSTKCTLSGTNKIFSLSILALVFSEPELFLCCQEPLRFVIKQITICKVPAHIGVKGNEEADRAAKQVIDIPGMTTLKLPYTNYYLTIKRARNSEWQREWGKQQQ